MLQLGLSLIWLLRLLPWPVLTRVGQGLGLFFYYAARHRRHIARVNLRLCFPELAEGEREKLLREHFMSTARSLLERGVLWWSSAAAVRRMVRIEGYEHLEALRGKPVILLAPHFVGLDMGAVRLTLEGRIAAVYGPQRNKRMDAFLKRTRNRFDAMELISRKIGVRAILQSLSEGLPLYYLPDQDYGPRNALFIPFFGVPASTLTGLPRLARMAEAAVLPCVTYQTKEGYLTRIYPAWENFPGEDVAADTRRMNAFIEARVREAPAQYYWLHRRFKTRPPGEPSFYK